MDQQDSGPDAPRPPAVMETAKNPRRADESANDPSWGIGSASALDHLRRHDFRVRRSKPTDDEERPTSE